MKRQIGTAWRAVAIGAAVGASLLGEPPALRATGPPTPADLVLTGGRVVTVDAAQPEAAAVAVRGERIVAVGSAEQISAWIGPRTQVIPLAGRLVIPGLIDAHGHFLGLGRSRMMLDLTAAASWAQIVVQVAKAARTAQPGSWIVGHGWHQSKWDRPPVPNVEGYPVHRELTRVAPRNPVLLTHASGHMCVVNQRTLDLVGIDRDTRAPAGGEILHDATGLPTGVLRENAMDLVHASRQAAEQQRSEDQQRADDVTAVRLAGEECLRMGVTSFQDAGSSFDTIDLFDELAEQGRLPVRLWVMVAEDNGPLERRMEQYRRINAHDHFLTVRAVKRLIDGALGTHGAWLLEPYTDVPTSCGLNTLALDDLRATAELAIGHDYQLCVHAIGDRANREVLNIYEQVFRAHPDRQGLRWRIEHAQHLHPDDLPRFAQLGVIASMQFVHATSDGPFVIERLGPDRAREGAYAWNSLLRHGALIANGTDTPVERVDPLAGFCAAVSRTMRDGRAFFSEQCVTRAEALRAYTLDGAYAAFEEDWKGSVTSGKLADLVVLSQDLLAVPVERIPQTRVDYTILGGKIVYQRAD